MDYLKMEPLGDSAIMIRFGHHVDENIHRKVQTLANYLDRERPPGIIEYVPAFTNIAIFYDVIEAYSLMKKDHLHSPYEAMKLQFEKVLETIEVSQSMEPEIVEIPVCYGGEYGPDLEYVAEHNGLTSEEVINIHCGGQYLTYMVGFAPGFPYLGGLSEKIAAPRKESPRLEIPAGTVGIAGNQTGVYPISTPGGWQLIGRTPLPLFQPGNESPTLIKAGNIVVFKPISESEYVELLKVKK